MYILYIWIVQFITLLLPKNSWDDIEIKARSFHVRWVNHWIPFKLLLQLFSVKYIYKACAKMFSSWQGCVVFIVFSSSKRRCMYINSFRGSLLSQSFAHRCKVPTQEETYTDISVNVELPYTNIFLPQVLISHFYSTQPSLFFTDISLIMI